MSENSYNVAVIHGNEMRGAPKKLANALWFIFYGLWYGISTIFMGIGYCCTLIFIPMGIQYFKSLKLVFMPFGKDVVTHFGRRGFLNVCWLIFGAGIEAFLILKFFAFIFKLTVVAYPVGVQLDKYARFWLAPFGAEILNENQYSLDKENARDIQLVLRHAVANPDVELSTSQGRMPLRQFMEQKKPEVEWYAQKVILSKSLMIFAAIVAVIGLVAGILGGVFKGLEPVQENLALIGAGPIMQYVGWPVFGLFFAIFAWRLVMIITKLQVKRYQGMKGFLASGFDEKINTLVYKKMFKGLYYSYQDIDGLVTKKERTGNFRYLYHELGMDLDVMSQVKQPQPTVDTNCINIPVPVAPAPAAQAAAPAAEPAPAPAPEKNYFDDLKKLNDLKDAGVITEEEYNKKKEEILSKI